MFHHLSFWNRLLCHAGTGSPSFQRSSLWTQSWPTRSKTIKTFWPLRAMSSRASSLTSTVCEWKPCSLLTVGLNISVCGCLCHCALFNTFSHGCAEPCYAGSLASPLAIKAFSAKQQLSFSALQSLWMNKVRLWTPAVELIDLEKVDSACREKIFHFVVLYYGGYSVMSFSSQCSCNLASS